MIILKEEMHVCDEETDDGEATMTVHSLSLDVKTCCYSLFDMLQRYIKLCSCMANAIIYFGSASVVNDEDFQLCKKFSWCFRAY